MKKIKNLFKGKNFITLIIVISSLILLFSSLAPLFFFLIAIIGNIVHAHLIDTESPPRSAPQNRAPTPQEVTTIALSEHKPRLERQSPDGYHIF